MKRHYYISDDISELQRVENELEESGFSRPQIHVLTEDDFELEKRHINGVDPFLRKDIVLTAEIGAVVGILLSISVLGLAYFFGWYETFSWAPFLFLSIVILGFCTWEGGLIGMHLPHRAFKRFQTLLKQGQHVLMVDSKESQESRLGAIVRMHPKLMPAGTGKSTPSMVISAQNGFRSFTRFMP
ncbi:NAD/FAD-utilizing enzyme [Aurantivibrio plasticivorans]